MIPHPHSRCLNCGQMHVEHDRMGDTYICAGTTGSRFQASPTPEEVAAGLIDAIISAYHTTRLADTPAALHILSKAHVKAAFARYDAQPCHTDLEAMRKQGQEEGQRAVLSWLRSFDAYVDHDPVKAAAMAKIADDFEQSRIPHAAQHKDQFI